MEQSALRWLVALQCFGKATRLLVRPPQALTKSGSMLGDFPIRVSSSKTAIVPVRRCLRRQCIATAVHAWGVMASLHHAECLRQPPAALCGAQHVVALRTPAALAARHPPPCPTLPTAPLLPQVNNTYLPRSQEERELVARTIFVGNIDRIVEREQLREFFENLCGEQGGRPAQAGSFWNGHILLPPASEALCNLGEVM